MKNILRIEGLLILTIFLGACEENETEPYRENTIIGSWVFMRYEDSLKVLSKKQALANNKYGFSLLPDGVFWEHKNSGGCATPPVSYTTYKGTWERINDSIVHIQVGYWGGRMKYNMKIVMLISDTLKIHYHYLDIVEQFSK